MNAPAKDAEAIFFASLDRSDPQERAAFVEAACSGDPGLLARVRQLLMAHDQSQGPLDQLPPGVAVTQDLPISEPPGTVIGSYKLLEQIGEGGFGVVYLAEQSEPVRRKVALKILKPGMDTRQVVARFEAERQALAIMDHPNIAKVFDGGATPSGRPYFVMELVKGVAITDFCDQNHLTPRQRLELFTPVCQAVQHAHQKGIIHRDLKPSNVLVTRHDSTPIVKVIDFGVAKALGHELTDKTLFTGVAQMIGTPLYMSPEQAGMSDWDVDTRSDIYSLGVLLYELLTGTTPFDKQRFQKAAYDEIRRIIREEDPPKPSTRLTESNDALPSISAQRQTEPAKLTRMVRGELDWIVMKCLEKDRNRRYETANGLAMDLQRYLTDEPVQACPPSASYRLRKFVRRNRLTVTIAVLAAMFLGIVGGGAGWIFRDRAARRTIVESEITQAIQETETAARSGRYSEARAAAKHANALMAGMPINNELLHRARQWQADLDLVIALQEASVYSVEIDVVNSRMTDAGMLARYESLFRDYGIDCNSTSTAEAAAKILSRPLEIKLVFLGALEHLRWRTGHPLPRGIAVDQRRREWFERVIAESDSDPWRLRARQAADRSDYKSLEDLAHSDDLNRQVPYTMKHLAMLLEWADKPDLAIMVLRRAQHIYPSDFTVNSALGTALINVGPSSAAEAARYCAIAVALNPDNAGARLNLGFALHTLGKVDDAIAEFQKVIELKPNYANAHYSLGNAFRVQNKLDAAVAAYREAIRWKPDFASAFDNLGETYRLQHRLEDAATACREALRLNPTSFHARSRLGGILLEMGKRDEGIAEYRKAAEQNPRNSLAHMNLGVIFRQHAKLPEAATAMRRAIELEPVNADYHNELGAILFAQGRFGEAAEEFRTVTKLSPNFPDGHFNLGNALLKSGGSSEAVAEYRIAVFLKPDNPRFHYLLGDALRISKDLDGAIAAYKQALTIAPNYTGSLIKLGKTLFDQGNSEHAVALLRLVVAAKPESATAHNLLGIALRAQGKLDEAATEFRKFAELRPDNVGAYHNLGIVFGDLGKPAEAIESFRKAIALNEKEAMPYYGLASLLADCPDLKLRDPNEALKLGRRALELGLNDAFVWQAIGIANYRLGRWKPAIEAFDKSDEHRKGAETVYKARGFNLAVHTFFRAMTLWHLGPPGEARKAYDSAVQLMSDLTPRESGQAKRLHEEAARLLKIQREMSPKK
jgi:tetratricopeptide (TPR) repeat protein/serine/threonine protein kinase